MSVRLLGNLKRSAIAYAGQITALARKLAPRHLQAGISSHVEDKNDGTFIIRTTAVGADSRAWEYGSGLHRRRGTKGKYLIQGKPWLAFFGTNGHGNAFGAFNPTTRKGVGEKNIVVVREVHHPGIEAANSGKGYIAPAQAEIRKRLRETLSKDIRDAIVGDLRESFVRK